MPSSPTQAGAATTSAQQSTAQLGATVPLAAGQLADATWQAPGAQFDTTAPMPAQTPARDATFPAPEQSPAPAATMVAPQTAQPKQRSASRTPLVIAIVCLAVAVVALVFAFVIMPALSPGNSNTTQGASSSASTPATHAQDDSDSAASSQATTSNSAGTAAGSTAADAANDSASSGSATSGSDSSSSSPSSSGSAASGSDSASNSSSYSTANSTSSDSSGSSNSESTPEATGGSTADDPASGAPASSIALSLADAGNYHDINLFLSNFAEVSIDELDTNNPDNEKFVRWAIVHLFINRQDLIEIDTKFRYQMFHQTQDGSTDDTAWDTRTRTANLYQTASKYFDFDFTVPAQPNDDPSKAYLTNGDYTYWTTTGGNPRSGFAISTNLTDLGNNRYAVDFEIHGVGNGEIATATNDLPSLTPEQASAYDLAPIQNGIAIIRVSGSSANPSFVLEYYRRQA